MVWIHRKRLDAWMFATDASRNARVLGVVERNDNGAWSWRRYGVIGKNSMQSGHGTESSCREAKRQVERGLLVEGGAA